MASVSVLRGDFGTAKRREASREVDSLLAPVGGGLMPFQVGFCGPFLTRTEVLSLLVLPRTLQSRQLSPISVGLFSLTLYDKCNGSAIRAKRGKKVSAPAVSCYATSACRFKLPGKPPASL